MYALEGAAPRCVAVCAFESLGAAAAAAAAAAAGCCRVPRQGASARSLWPCAFWTVAIAAAASAGQQILLLFGVYAGVIVVHTRPNQTPWGRARSCFAPTLSFCF